MPTSFSFGDIHLDVTPGESPAKGAPEPETPFRIAVLGDFSGRGSRGIVETGRDLARRRPMLIDRDNFDDVMEKLGVEIHLPVAGSMRFKELDDFHPDQLYAGLPMFQKLEQVKEELPLRPPPAVTPAEQRPAPAPQPGPGLEGLLEQAVEETAGRIEERPAETRDEFQAWLKETVAPHLAPKADPRQAELRSLVESTAAAQMRAVMHYPVFQELEAAWRALFFLVRRAETGAMLKIYLIDVTKQELAADLGAAVDPRDTGTCRLLAESPGDAPWAVLAGNYAFGVSSEDLQLLARLATIARTMGAPWLAAADASLLGCNSLAETPDPDDWTRQIDPGWRALRQLPVASSVGLALPRFLLRLPYGNETDPCEQFAFEEMGVQPEHDRYLWGNPAMACAYLLAESFVSHGWQFRPGMHLDVDSLPLHIYEKDGEPCATPCAEALLTERAAERILEGGLMPLASLKETDSVRLVRFQSIAEPPAALAGRWAPLPGRPGES